MRAVRVTAPGKIETVEVDEPSGEGVRVRVTSCGICGSDHHLAEMGVRVTLGHEITGVLADGSPVVIEPYAPCEECDRCLGGDPVHCRNLKASYGISADGGLADEILVAPWAVIPVPAALPPKLSALAEPTAVGIHGLNRVGATNETRTLVIGAGSIGLLAAAASLHRGAPTDIVARHDHQRAAAEAIGASLDVVHGYDLVVDAAGSQGSLDQALSSARPGGTVLSLGTYWTPVSINAGFTPREVSIVPAMAYGFHQGRREFVDAVELLAARPELADSVVSHEVSLDDATEAFRISNDRSAGARKVVVVP